MCFTKKCILSHEGYQQLSSELLETSRYKLVPECLHKAQGYFHSPFHKPSQSTLKWISNPPKSKNKTNKQSKIQPKHRTILISLTTIITNLYHWHQCHFQSTKHTNIKQGLWLFLLGISQECYCLTDPIRGQSMIYSLIPQNVNH